jgi:predicted GIY-YIG superfamily endonuclease
MLVIEVLKSQGSSLCWAEKGKMICVHETFDRSTTLVMTEKSGKRWKSIEKESLCVEKKFELENQYEWDM